ncbi:glycosyltransferase family 4 protein [Tellurirhabdus bombi]|uniref:glycosyltransferase family 4 protein n=1 Tax=Tellurirhabdus bombi TaxID=2907205 RepID=UPI001F411717|nr:glycosyltransferase family 4 protein [Tellurirhabdus bombi]
MRILLIHQYFLDSQEGGGSRWNEMSRLWAEKGHKVTVLAGMVSYTKGVKSDKYKGKYFYQEDYVPGVNIVRCHVSEAYNVNFLGRLWAYFSFVFSSIWAGMFKIKGQYDVIVVTSPPLFVGITAYVLSSIKRVPFVFEVRDLWPESAIDTGVLTNKLIIRFAYWFEQFVYRKARLINVLTPAFRDTLIQKKGVPAEKICFIPNAADFSLSEELLHTFDAKLFRRELGIDDKLVITYVGAHGVANHLVQVLDTAERLRDTKAYFMLIGDGMQKKELMRDAQQRGLANVRFIDSVAKREVFKFILASDLGTSVLKKADTFKTVYSNKTFDYMACKKPILMVIDGISRQLVEEAQAGVFVEPEAPDKYTAEVQNYLQNPDLIAKQGTNGYLYAKKHFDRTVLADNYITILEKCIGQGSSH